MTGLRKYSLVYLATPYTLYHAGIDVAYEDACRLSARLLLDGVKIFSPIVHSHAIAEHGNLDPLDHSFWLPINESTMQASDALLVAKMVGWENSFGVSHEIEWFTERGKPVHYLDPVTLAVQ